MTKQEAIKQAMEHLERASAPRDYGGKEVFNPLLEERQRWATTGLGYATLALSLEDEESE